MEMELVRKSLYWDDFERRIQETVSCLRNGVKPPVRRVAVFITERCNFRCKYCNHVNSPRSMDKQTFLNLIEKYGDDAIIHITGGEPSVVPWLYDTLDDLGDKYRIHLNSNAFIAPPARKLKRLKASLDSCNGTYWNKLVGRNAFDKVISNIRDASKETVTSITYTLTNENYRHAVEFARFANETFPNLYAVFFSVYKGANPAFAMVEASANAFFDNVLPDLLEELHGESRALLEETIDEKLRIIQGVRFPQNLDRAPCYISMSERVVDPSGKESTCSHLYRDGVVNMESVKHKKCVYGCNRRLVQFNEIVHSRLALNKPMLKAA